MKIHVIFHHWDFQRSVHMYMALMCSILGIVSTQVSSSTYNVMKRIVAENGVSGLFAGKYI